MELVPRLIDVTVPASPVGAVLVLHGGASRGPGVRVSPTQLSVVRMSPIAARVAREGDGRLAVFRVLNRYRGWDEHASPVDDARWAISEVRSRVGDVPFCLVGHSLGGRAALMTAGHPAVVSVAALAPWVYADDRPSGIADKQVLIVHGDRDRVASPGRAEELARRWRVAGADVEFRVVPGGKHAMLRHRDAFDGAAARFAAATLAAAAEPQLAPAAS